MPKTPHDPGATRAFIRRLRELRKDPALREAEGVFVAEGIHLAQAAMDAAAPIELAVISSRLVATAEGTELRRALASSATPILEVDPGVLDGLQDARTPQPVLLLARRHVRSVDELLAGETRAHLLVIAWAIQDPGNLGSILRSALAAGATGAVVVGGGADLFHPRTVRATSGAIFRLPVAVSDPQTLLSALRRRAVALVAADPAGDLPYHQHDLRGPVALLFGQEGSGLPQEVLGQASARLRIPMRARVESLSVGAAAAVLLFEAARQRQEL